MIGRLAAFFIAGIALPLTAAPAQPAADPAALDLARILMTRDETLYGDGDQGRARQQIQEALLASPDSCNAYLDECQAAAAAVAREFAPNFRQAERARAERITAFLLADTLRPEEMARIAQYLRGADGGKLLGALALLRQGEGSERRRRELDRLVPRSGLGSLDAARARFRRLTRNTPRAAPR
ncbi:MAG: hypothetical protein QOD42_2770 [Sphingomonadales bacterium]|jgi:hypothetical protein|nr:hypothetical protein [Sphingomonadales bacterium]